MSIYTIGYDHMQPPRLVRLMEHLQIDLLVDSRSIPQSRRPGFGGQHLRQLFPQKYAWQGQNLGGRGAGATAEGIGWLAGYEQSKRLLLLCKEEAPAMCHRHFQIALKLLDRLAQTPVIAGVDRSPLLHHLDCLHVYRDEIILASELQGAIEQQRPYDILATLPAEFASS